MIKQFFLMACLIVVTGSFLLLWDSQPESFLRSDSGKVEELPIADSYMRNTQAFMFSADGAKKYSLKASEISFFSGLSELKISQPELIAHATDTQKNQFKIEANNGLLTKNMQIFEFNGDVIANWKSEAGETVLEAGILSFSIKDDTALARGGVQLTTPTSKITGDRLSVDFESESLKIESRVRGSHESI